MTLLLTSEDIAGLVTIPDAIRVMDGLVREEFAGTTVHMAPFGGSHARPAGLPAARTEAGQRAPSVLRAVGGGAFRLGRIGMRAGGVSLVFGTEGGGLLSIMGGGFSSLRISALVGLAAQHLSRPEAHTIAL